MTDSQPPSSPAPASSSRVLLLWRSFSRLADRCAHHFNGDLRASLFSAALAVLALNQGALAILTKLSLLLVSNQALLGTPQVPLDGNGPLVLYLSETQWQQRYLERAPLDRCKLAEDLAGLLARQPRQLLVDFDLSPGQQDAGDGCQQRLDRLLDQHGQQLVLLMPYRVGSEALIAYKAAWLAARCQAGVVFGDGGLNVSLGAVIDFVPDSDGMADAMHQRAQVRTCAELATAEGRQRWLRRGAEAGIDDSTAEPINFASFSKQVVALALDDPALQGVSNWAGRDVYFGGDYGGSKDDRFLTPMGPLPGVAIHAAIGWTLAHAVHELPHAYGVLADILTAFVFSLGIGVFWRSYLKVSIDGKGLRRQNSTWLVIALVAYFALMLWLFFQLSVVLFMRGVLLAPLLIGLSMLIDGFVRGPIDASLALHSEAAGSGHAATAHATISLPTGAAEPVPLNGTPTPRPARAVLAPPEVMAVLLSALIAGVAVLYLRRYHLHWGWQLSLLTLLAMGLDRLLPELWRAPRAHAAQESHQAPALWQIVGWMLCAALLGEAVDRYASLGLGWLLAGFVGVIAGLLLLLLVGLPRSVHGRSFRTPGRRCCRHMLGIRRRALSWGEAAGLLAFSLRHAVYWAVLVAALMLILSH